MEAHKVTYRHDDFSNGPSEIDLQEFAVYVLDGSYHSVAKKDVKCIIEDGISYYTYEIISNGTRIPLLVEFSATHGLFLDDLIKHIDQIVEDSEVECPQ